MKSPVAIWFAIVLALAASTFLVLRLCLRPGVSMSLLEYRRWPHGAVLRLKNDTRVTIRYLAEENGLPFGNPLLRVTNTTNHWSGSRSNLRSSPLLDPRTRKVTREVFFLAPDTPRAGDRIESLLDRELKPGHNVDFFVRVEPGASPQRIGTICLAPQSELAKKLQPWLSRIKHWCGMQITVPGQFEVWCPQPIWLPLSVETSRYRDDADLPQHPATEPSRNP